ncbi:MAG: hypothetical protein KDB14_29550 [Planctomycetales bacterium]|nr:hypothetical protein [Planctomycetales bacterium]
MQTHAGPARREPTPNGEGAVIGLGAAVVISCTLLGLGRGLLAAAPPLRKLYIPGSVLAGFLGLGAFQWLQAEGWLLQPDQLAPDADSLAALLADAYGQLRTWPKWLIAVVFAGLLLGQPERSWRQSAASVWQEGLVVWIIALGQATVGLVATWLVLQPLFGVSPAFGMLIETGFAGGHGTAGAMGEVFPRAGVPDGRDLGMLMATAGLVASVTTGILYINVASLLGWLPADSRPTLPAEPVSTSDPGASSRRMAIATGLKASALLAASFGCGIGIARITTLLANALDMGDLVGDALPLFIYTLFGGLAVRHIARLLGLARWLDAVAIQRLTGVMMEFLVVAAIATLRLEAVVRFAAPLAVLFSVALIWCAFCLFFVARWLLPAPYWFQLGLLNYGMSTGTTATGFVLLRVVDPQLRSGAAEVYALASPLSSPFVGGGMITLALPMIVAGSSSPAIPCLVLSVALLALFAAGFWLRTGQSTGPNHEPNQGPNRGPNQR